MKETDSKLIETASYIFNSGAAVQVLNHIQLFIP